MSKLKDFLNYRLDWGMFGIQILGPPNWVLIILGCIGSIGIMIIS